MNKHTVSASRRLANVKYEIRGELAHRARELEARGQSIFRLNIGMLWVLAGSCAAGVALRLAGVI